MVDEEADHTSPRRRTALWFEGRSAPTVVLALASVVAAVFFLIQLRGQYFISDEWLRWLVYPAIPFGEQVKGLSGHLVIGNVLAYRALLEVFGADSYLPFGVLAMVIQLAVVWLLYWYVRPRANQWFTVAICIILLFLGPSRETVTSAYGIIILIPIALGLGAFLLLEKQSTKADIGACLLFVLATLSWSGAIPMTAAALVLVIVSRGRDQALRAWWVFLIPALTYVTWFIWSRANPATQNNPVAIPSPRNFLQAAAEIPASGFSALVGLSGLSLDPKEFNLLPGYIFLALTVFAFIYLFASHRLRFNPYSLVPLAALVVFTVLIASVLGSKERNAFAPRYLYITVLLLGLFLLEASRYVEWNRLMTAVAAGVFMLALTLNTVLYTKHTAELRDVGAEARATLAALDLAGPALANDYLPRDSLEKQFYWGGYFSKWRGVVYREISNRFGNDARALPPDSWPDVKGRQVVDLVLFDAEAVRGEPRPSTGGERAGCSTYRQLNGRKTVLKIKTGESLELDNTSANQLLEFTLGRFAYPNVPGGVARETTVVLSFPEDGSTMPWKFRTTSKVGSVCVRPTRT